jgi:hypothetical protein
MSRLILTFEDVAAGALMGTGFADCVIPFGLRFNWGRLWSQDELEALLSWRSKGSRHWAENFGGGRLDEAQRLGLDLAEFCERFDVVELWADHQPNVQLQLAWMLDHLRTHADVVARAALVQTDIRIASCSPGEWVARRPRAVPIHNDHLEIASATWAAWRSPTPVEWFDLLAQDLSALPQLRNTVLALLEELPMRNTGIGVTETRMLELLAAGHAYPFDLFPGHEKPNDRRTYGYWEVGELLDGLARCTQPAVAGLSEGPFDDALHEDSDRHDRYRKSKLSLTELGKAVLEQSEDFRRHNPIHRWWGGTELTSDRLWRWDPESRKLVAP